MWMWMAMLTLVASMMIVLLWVDDKQVGSEHGYIDCDNGVGAAGEA